MIDKRIIFFTGRKVLVESFLMGRRMKKREEIKGFHSPHILFFLPRKFFYSDSIEVFVRKVYERLDSPSRNLNGIIVFHFYRASFFFVVGHKIKVDYARPVRTKEIEGRKARF